MKEAMAKEQPAVGTVQKALTATFFILMAVIGLSNIIIGSMAMGRCGNAVVLPVMLVINGVLWMSPLAVLALVNCVRQAEDLVGLYSCLEKLFLFIVAFMVASTIYVLVSSTQVKTLDALCTHTWVPPYSLAVIIADWICFIVFFRLFCVHQLPPEEPPMEFKHLKNLPPLVFPWNRHRVLRTY